MNALASRRLVSWLAMRNVDTVSKARARHQEFEVLVAQIRESGTDSLSHFGNGYTLEGGLCLQQNPDEFASLCLFLRERSPLPRYMEIGTASGGTCLFLHRLLAFESVTSLDDGNHPRAIDQPKNLAGLKGFRQFVGDSHSVAAREFLEKNALEPFDVAFIDGDHSYKGVCEDIDLTLPFCRPGALVIFHDTVACPDVRKAWVNAIGDRRLTPLAEYVGRERPLGISVNAVG